MRFPALTLPLLARLALPGFAVLSIALLWTVLYARITDEQNYALDSTAATTQALSQDYADRTVRTLRQIDQATQFIKFSFELRHQQFSLNELVNRKGILPKGMPLGVTISDSNGDGVSGVRTISMSNIADRDYFKTLQVRDQETLFISRPLLEPFSTTWTIVLSRRLNHPDGSFAGIVAIALPQSLLTEFGPRSMDKKSFLALLGTDGTLRASRIGNLTFSGEDKPFGGWIKRRNVRRAVEFIADNPVDHIGRMVSYQQLDEFPLVAVVGLEDAQVLRSFRAHRMTVISWGVVGTLAILGFLILLMRQSVRLRRSEVLVAEARAAFHAAAESSLDALMILRSQRNDVGRIQDFSITDLNDRAAALLGRSREALIGQSLRAVAPLLGRNGNFEKYLHVIESGVPVEEELSGDGSSAGPRWLRQQIVRIEDGVAITTRDISARKEADLKTRSDRAFLQSLIENLPLIVYVRDLRNAAGQMIVWNKTAELVTGYAADEVLHRREDSIFPQWMSAIFHEFEARMRADPVLIDTPEVRFRSRDQSVRYLRIISVPLLDDAGKLEYILGIAEDITNARRQALALRSKQAELAAANDASPLGLFRTSRRGKCTYANRTYEDMSGLSNAEVMGNGWIKAIHPEDRLQMFQRWSKASREHAPFQTTYRFLHADGRIVWVSMKTAPILVDGRVHGYVGSVDDITARREAEQALTKSEQRLRIITDTLPALIAYIDSDQRFRFNNLAYERAYAVPRDEIRNQTVREFVGALQYALIAPYLQRAFAGETVTFEYEETKDGHRCWSEATYIPQRADDNQAVIGIHSMVHDITAKKQEEHRLLQLSQIDSLTGLVNRAGFEQKLAAAMDRSRAAQRLMALLYLDIDHFKNINDTHGHLMGDALLKAFSGRLSRTLRGVDTVARLGGDEFVVIMEDLPGPAEAEKIAAKIVQSMGALFKLEGSPLSVTASIGLTFYQGTALDASTLIKQADEMLYQAKARGRNQFCVWTAQDNMPPAPVV